MLAAGHRLRGVVRGALASAVARPALPLLAIAFIGGSLRLTGVEWDDGAHLHPDERYLSIVADGVDWPDSPRAYFDVEQSPLSPYNTAAGANYVYGVLPLLATKAVAALAGRDTYSELYVVGRSLSAVLDTASVVLVFLLVRLLFARAATPVANTAALLAAALYALAVTAIQHAHFFTVESWLVCFTLVTLYAAALVSRTSRDTAPSRSLLLLLATGAGLGLTVGAKASGALVVIPIAVALVAHVARGGGPVASRVTSFLGASVAVAVSAYLTARVLTPYAFEHSSWLDPTPNRQLREALEAQREAVSGEFLYPPAYQWLLSTPIVDPLRSEVVWGLGVPLGIAAVAGIGWLAVDLARAVPWPRRPGSDPRTASVVNAMLLTFVLFTFFYFGSRFAHSIRYLVPMVPLLCAAAAVGLTVLRGRSAFVGRVAISGVLVATLFYALAFVQIYRAPHTRIAASVWLVAEAPPGATIVSEHWDDALPVQAKSAGFQLVELPVFDPDDDTKLRKLYDGLAGSDYYALSSPRAWNTIGRLPDRFPVMVRFYRLLRGGDLGFRKAAQFTSYPRLLGVELDDLRAEEAFWVYDHPPVILYEHVDRLTWPRFRAAVCAGPPLPGCA